VGGPAQRTRGGDRGSRFGVPSRRGRAGEPGEREPIAVALREGREETGLTDLVPWPDGSLVHLAVVPVSAKGAEPAHEHADLRFVLATGEPDAIRPETPDAPLRWLTVPEAVETAGTANVQETLSRVATLITGDGRVSARTP
jgi:8-oxo-dGTP pyrophosphatase MutT (NUDIX family)